MLKVDVLVVSRSIGRVGRRARKQKCVSHQCGSDAPGLMSYSCHPYVSRVLRSLCSFRLVCLVRRCAESVCGVCAVSARVLPWQMRRIGTCFHCFVAFKHFAVIRPLCNRLSFMISDFISATNSYSRCCPFPQTISFEHF